MVFWVTRLVGIAAVAAAIACHDPFESDSIEKAIESENALSMNALSMNALSMNALSMNALSMNGLELDGGDLATSDEGRHLLKYVVRCAIREGTTLTTTVDGVTYSFDGLLGLAHHWLHDDLGSAGERLVSACLLAHVNAFGISVPISTRHPALAVTPEEEMRFSYFEGGFFGDLFADPPRKYVCAGDPAPDFSVAYPDHDKSAGDRLLRRCSDLDGSLTVCGFESVGSCSSICDDQGCWRNGSFYDSVEVWVLHADDPWSVWPFEYDHAYGP